MSDFDRRQKTNAYSALTPKLSSECSDECTRQEKHQMLFHAVNSMDMVTERLESLLLRITGEDRAKCSSSDPMDPPDIPSLLHLLDQAPVVISDKREVQLDLINKIVNVLF